MTAQSRSYPAIVADRHFDLQYQQGAANLMN
jgi:hypothetical protein